MQVGELQDDVTGLARGGAQVAGSRAHVAGQRPGGGVLGDPARVVAVSVVVVDLGGGLGQVEPPPVSVVNERKRERIPAIRTSF
ncbi:hypothetical protein GCM10010254_71270 [Streptomyces chromofuscus]|nr:hypothetical protein GCM10010254_71270 [Streptomyces chromofuscus]